jgi:hypothetical protein
LIALSLQRKKGVNAYVLYINDPKEILNLVNLLNGNMRTPKIYSLFNLIDWLNNKNSNLNLKKLPLKSLESEILGEDAWLSGMIESDGHFSVRSTLPKEDKEKYAKIECKFEFSQLYREDMSESGKLIMMKIANYLEIKDYSFKQTKTSNYIKFTIKTQNIRSNEILINYLTKYPIWSRKFLDFKDWLVVLGLYTKLKKKDNSCSNLEL